MTRAPLLVPACVNVTGNHVNSTVPSCGPCSAVTLSGASGNPPPAVWNRTDADDWPEEDPESARMVTWCSVPGFKPKIKKEYCKDQENVAITSNKDIDATQISLKVKSLREHGWLLRSLVPRFKPRNESILKSNGVTPAWLKDTGAVWNHMDADH